MNYNLGDFELAVAGFKSALERHQEAGSAADHRLWGNYADAQRHAGRNDGALGSYTEAITLVEDHLANGDGNPVHEIALLYYQTMLATLSDNPLDTSAASLDGFAAFRCCLSALRD